MYKKYRSGRRAFTALKFLVTANESLSARDLTFLVWNTTTREITKVMRNLRLWNFAEAERNRHRELIYTYTDLGKRFLELMEKENAKAIITPIDIIFYRGNFVIEKLRNTERNPMTLNELLTKLHNNEKLPLEYICVIKRDSNLTGPFTGSNTGTNEKKCRG